uniref:BAG family molecular chaperone regulator 1 n=1 Tax=Trichuris muris TaxID=70415 RepID=A0A5S6QT37_TRIMR
MQLQIIYGPRRHSIDLPLESEPALTLLQLKEQVGKTIGVAVENLKLIFGGRLLVGDETPLSTLKFKQGDRIMVLGKQPPVNAELESRMKYLRIVEKDRIGKIGRKLDDLAAQVDGLTKGFLADSLVNEAVERLRKQLNGLCEDCMKTLESMDALSLGDRSLENARMKRKLLTDRIQGLLKFHDRLLERLEEYMKEREEERK